MEVQTIDKERLKRRFSERALTYDRYATVQKTMAETLHQLLHAKTNVQQPVRILEIGCGTGEFTRRLLDDFPDAAVTAVDFAPGMLRVAKDRLPYSERVDFICADIEELDLGANTYDLIISNATFQWLAHLQQTIKKLFGSLRAGGRLLFSTFLEGTFCELHTAYARSITENYAPARLGPQFFTRQDLEWLVRVATESNELFIREQSYLTYYPTVRSFLRSIQRVGATNSQTSQTILRPSFVRNLLAEYEQAFRTSKGVQATYYACYLEVTKNHDRNS